MPEENNKLKVIIEKSSEIGGSVSGAAIGLAIAGPVGAIGGAFAGPLIAQLFKKIGTEVSEKLLGNREEIRVGATFSMAYDKIQNDIQNGRTLRTDSFNESTDGLRSGAAAILEGTLMKARNEYEEKKIKYYSNFLANINLDSSVSFEKGNTLLRIIEQLSYRQIVILSYIESVENIDTIQWLVSFKNKEELGEFQDFYSELMDLYNQQLLQQTGTEGFSMMIVAMKISPFGSTLCNLINTTEIPKEEKQQIGNTINEINRKK